MIRDPGFSQPHLGASNGVAPALRDPGFSRPQPGMLSPQHIAALQGLLAQFAPQTKPRMTTQPYHPGQPIPHPALAQNGPYAGTGNHMNMAWGGFQGQSPFGFLAQMFQPGVRKPGQGPVPGLLPKRNMPAYGQPYNPYGGSNGGNANVPMPY